MRDNLIVYGSLINKKELFGVFDYVTKKEVIPIRLNGFKRVFNQEEVWRKGSGKKIAVLNVVKSDNSWFNGILVRSVNENYFKFIDKREEGYKRIKVDPTSIKFVYGISTKLEGQIWIYTGKEHKMRKDILPIPSYLDICLEGTKEWGEGFYNDFLITTFLPNGQMLIEFLKMNQKFGPKILVRIP